MAQTMVITTLEELTQGARKTQDGKISVTDVIMMVKKCTRNSASRILRQLRNEERIPELELIIFGANIDEAGLASSSWGGSRHPEAAADARQIVQVIWALPGDSAFRRKSADVVVRYLGGDLNMLNEVISNRAAQEVLVRENPQHPARLFGEAVETETSEALKRKREETESIELDLRCEKARSEMKKVQVDAYVACFERAASMGVQPDDRAKLQLRDFVGSLASPSSTSRKEICVRAFLLSKNVNPREFESKLGKIVAKLKREKLRAAGLPDVLLKKTIEANGQIVEANLYFEDEDSDVFDKGWEALISAPKAKASSKRRRRA
jgi:hypothetical protein